MEVTNLGGTGKQGKEKLDRGVGWEKWCGCSSIHLWK